MSTKPKRPRKPGRPLEQPSAGPRRRRTIWLTGPDWAALREIGGGNGSDAVRRLLTWWARRRKRP